tara:strand:- start:1018 stop:1953 length:936 start_codon:yes stop_codon:yes gene_type:complete
MEQINKKLLVLGSQGLVGTAIKRSEIINQKFIVHYSNRAEADLTNKKEVESLFTSVKPNITINCAGKVGGILANNTQRYEFLTENLLINLNLFETLKTYENSLLINLGSSSIYPKNSKYPLKESSLMTGPLEETNAAYSLSKIVGIAMGKAIESNILKTINLIPTNLYGPNDNFDSQSSHVVPGLINKFYKAQQKNDVECVVWGSGKPTRELLFVDDLVSALEVIIESSPKEEIINVGSGSEISIKDLANKISLISGYKGKVIFDTSKPDGVLRKTLDSSLISSLNWSPKVDLDDGLKRTYEWYKKINDKD